MSDETYLVPVYGDEDEYDEYEDDDFDYYAELRDDIRRGR